MDWSWAFCGIVKLDAMFAYMIDKKWIIIHIHMDGNKCLTLLRICAQSNDNNYICSIIVTSSLWYGRFYISYINLLSNWGLFKIYKLTFHPCTMLAFKVFSLLQKSHGWRTRRGDLPESRPGRVGIAAGLDDQPQSSPGLIKNTVLTNNCTNTPCKHVCVLRVRKRNLCHTKFPDAILSSNWYLHDKLEFQRTHTLCALSMQQ